MIGKPDTPFPQHCRYFLALKAAVIVGAVALAPKWFGYW
jgi:hypothetical protein